MRRRSIYRFNSWFEWELDSLIRTGSLPRLTRPQLNRDRFLEKLFLALSEPEDIVLLKSLPSSELIESWKKHNWSYASYMISHEDESHLLVSYREDYLLTEFGAVRQFHENRIFPSEIIWRNSAFFNSRINQKKFSDENHLWEGSISPDGRIFYNQDDVVNFLESMYSDIYEKSNDDSGAYLFKSEFSSSGRGHILWRGPKDNHRLLKLKYPVLGEKYHDNRSLDFGILFHGEAGVFSDPLGISIQKIGEDFQFKGCVYFNSTISDCIGELSLSNENSVIDLLDTIQNQGNEFLSWNRFENPETYSAHSDEPIINATDPSKTVKYSGPVSWDGYFSKSGDIRFRSEINYRWSLGRLGWEIRQKKIRIHGDNHVKYYGLFILHSRESIPWEYDFLLPLAISDTEPWRIVYIEKG